MGDGHWEDSDYDGKTRCESHKKIQTLSELVGVGMRAAEDRQVSGEANRC